MCGFVSIDCKTSDTPPRLPSFAIWLRTPLVMASELLELLIVQAEGTKFWLQVVAELKNRVVKGKFIVSVDRLLVWLFGLPGLIKK